MDNSDDYSAQFELIARVSAGDMDAYDAMYRQYVAGATRVARTVANSSDESTDVVFEAFARLLVRLREHGEPGAGIEEYLRTIIRRLAIERHPDVTQGDVPPPHPDDPIGDHDQFTRVRDAYEALPDEWQQILWHAEVERKPQLALARGLDMSQSAVASLVLRSREGLRQAYGAIALADDVPEDCRDYAPNIPVHVKGMLPEKVARELDKHLRRCDVCEKFRGDYVLLLSDLRQTLFGALLRPADPSAVPVTTSAADAASGTNTAVGAIAATEAAAGADDETREVPIPALPPESSTPAALIADAEIDEELETGSRDRRHRGVLAGGVAVVAAATMFAAFTLLGGPDDPPSAGDDGYSDGQAGVDGGANAGERVLGAGPTVAVLSESAEGDGASGDGEGATAGDGGAADDGAARGSNAIEQRNDDPADRSADEQQPPALPDPGDTSDPDPEPSPSSSDDDDDGSSPQGEPPMPPEFISHPKNASAPAGETVTFRVEVDGWPEPEITWQRRASAGASWSDIADSGSTALRVTVTESKDGRQYRAVAANRLGTARSNAAALTVTYPAPTITTHPEDATTSAGGEVTFAASASPGSSFTDVWWEEYVDGAWTRMNIDVPAAENTSLRLKNVQDSRDGARFRAVFKNSAGQTATSPAELTVSGA